MNADDKLIQSKHNKLQLINQLYRFTGLVYLPFNKNRTWSHVGCLLWTPLGSQSGQQKNIQSSKCDLQVLYELHLAFPLVLDCINLLVIFVHLSSQGMIQT